MPQLSMRSGLFPATQWTDVLNAREAESVEARDALEALACAYWKPLYIFLRQRGAGEDSAADSVQGFFEHLLGTDFLAKVRVREGKFRTFLLTSFTNWLSNERAAANAQKRGGGAWHVPIDEVEEHFRAGLVAVDVPPEEAFDRGWARSLVELVVAGLAAEAEAAGRDALFAALKGTLSGEPRGETYAELGARLGMSEGAIKQAVFDLRGRFGEALRAHVRGTVESDAAVDDELRYLIRLLRS